MVDREKVMGDLTALAMFLKDKKDPISLLQANICTDALELLKAQRPVTLADMLIIRARMFMDEKDIAWITRRIEKQIQNGDKVLILPDYMEPVIVPKNTEVHIENTQIGTVPRRVNPSLSVNPPRIVPKNDKKKGQ